MRGIVVALCLIAGCASAQQPSGSSLPPALQRVLDDYTAAWSARDGAAMAKLFADGRTVVPNMCPPAQSRAEIEKCYSALGGGLHLRALDHKIDGSIGYIIGEYAGSASATASGKFVLTLARDASGRWLIVADMDREYRRQ